jgi:hypothetical protein
MYAFIQYNMVALPSWQLVILIYLLKKKNNNNHLSFGLVVAMSRALSFLPFTHKKDTLTKSCMCQVNTRGSDMAGLIFPP